MSISNEILNCIHQRRSTRRFTDQQVSSEQLEAILDAAIWAPIRKEGTINIIG